MKTGGMASQAMLALVGLASCNFEAAFNRYCDHNARCQADAGPVSDVGPDTGPDTGPDLGPDMGPDIGPDIGPDLGPDMGPNSEVNDAESWPPIFPPKTCASLNDCSGSNEVCHPLSQVCVKTCNGPTDCPPWLGNCSDTRGGPTRGPKVCSCTALSCSSYASGFVCDSDGSACKPACRIDQDCVGFPLPRACDPPSGLCKVIPQQCSVSADCPPAQPRCDSTSLVCTGCLSSSDCAGRTDGFFQCGPAGGCVGPQSGP